jgi:hypothetical protein
MGLPEVSSLPDEDVKRHAAEITERLSTLPIEEQLLEMIEYLRLITSYNREENQPMQRKHARAYSLAGTLAIGTFIDESKDELSIMRGESDGPK